MRLMLKQLKKNNMRSVFRKESKKISVSMRLGVSVDDVYAPQLWYYNLLLFLKDQEVSRLSVSNLDDVSSSIYFTYYIVYTLLYH